MDSSLSSFFIAHGIKRDHEEGICPITGKEFLISDTEDVIAWATLICSECGELIGARNCELRNHFTKNIDELHRLGVCPKTKKQFSFPMSKIIGDFVCSECGEVIDNSGENKH